MSYGAISKPYRHGRTRRFYSISTSNISALKSVNATTATKLQPNTSKRSAYPQNVHHNHNSNPRLHPRRHQSQLQHPRPRPHRLHHQPHQRRLRQILGLNLHHQDRWHPPPLHPPLRHCTPISSSSLLAAGPLLLTFYCGSWCPYCNLALHSLQGILPSLTARGVTLVAITPEVPSKAERTSAKNDLTSPVLSDIGNAYVAQLGILFPMPGEMKSVFDANGIDLKERNGDDSLVVPVPATILVGRDGIVKKVFIEADYSMRLEPSVALEWVDEMLRDEGGMEHAGISFEREKCNAMDLADDM